MAEALQFVELGGTLEKFPSELSGGMRRRAAIARAVVTAPPLILYDSPTAGLDPITAHTIVTLLIKERDQSHTTTLVVTHRYQDGNLIANFRYNSERGELEPAGVGAGRRYKTTFMVLREGRLVFEGNQDQLEASPDDYILKFVKRRDIRALDTMPDPRKVRWSKLRVGIVGSAAFSFSLFWSSCLTSAKGIFRQYATLRTYMDDASGLANGTAVRLNGITVGYLDKLQLTGSRDPKRTVEFDMKVQAHFCRKFRWIPTWASPRPTCWAISFSTSPKDGVAARAWTARELTALQAQDIPEMMAQMSNVLDSFQKIVGRADNLLAGVEAGKGNLGLLLKDDELYRRANAIAAEGQQLLSDVQQGPRHAQQDTLRRHALQRSRQAASSASIPCWPICRRGRAPPASCSRIRPCSTTPTRRSIRSAQLVARYQRRQRHGRPSVEGPCARPTAGRSGRQVQYHRR